MKHLLGQFFLPHLISLLERGLQKVLAEVPLASRYIDQLAGKIISFKSTTSNHPFCCSIFFSEQKTVACSTSLAQESDVLVIGSQPVLLKYLLRSSDQAPWINSGITIQGDIHLLIALQHLLQQATIHWDALIAKPLGEPIAYGAKQNFQRYKKWFGRAKNALTTNTKDYLHFETNLLITTQELQVLNQDITDLEFKTDRLQQKIALLLNASKCNSKTANRPND